MVIALIEAAKRSRYPELGLFFHVAAVTGARRGELIALRWSSIDLEHRQVLIDRSVIQVGRQVIEKDTKTHQARRLAIDVATAELLAAHRDMVVRRARMAGTEAGDESYVFSDRAGWVGLMEARPRHDCVRTVLSAGGCDRRAVP